MATAQIQSLGAARIVKIVDQIGQIDDQIKALKAQQDVLKAQIEENGTGTYRGRDYALTFAQSERTTVSWAKVAEEVKPAPEIVAKYSKTSFVNTFKVQTLVN
jgi:hypothetical protein